MMMNEILTIGVNHKVAPLAVRERLAFSSERIPPALKEITETLATFAPGENCPEDSGAVLLSTCNRTEIYACAADRARAELCLRRTLIGYAQMSPQVLNPLFYTHSGMQAARHLLQVASSLDSLVVGEDEILGQVKQAHEIANRSGACGPVLEALFRSAATTGKRVRSETEIGKTSLSVATVVVELAEELMGSLNGRTALLVGAGKISNLAARELVKAGLHCVLIANRTFERAQELAYRLGGGDRARAVHFDSLSDSLVEADIVICSTGAPHLVLYLGDVREAMTTRPDKPLLVVDLAVPRDADPDIANLPNVNLTCVDDLQELAHRRHPLTAQALVAAQGIVSEELEAFEQWRHARRCAPIIRALREKAEAICKEQLEHTLGRMGEITPQQQNNLEVMLEAIIGKLLHEPITFLRRAPEERSQEELISLMEQLFGLELSNEWDAQTYGS